MKLLALPLVIVLALAGCSAGESSEHPAEASSDHGESSEEVVGYPVGFPEKDVPFPDGELLHFAHPGNLWAAWVAADDLAASLAEATQLLLDAGYTQTVVADGYAEFTNPDRSLRIVAAVDDTWGSCLMYTFTDGAVEAPDAGEQDAQPPAEGEH